jgi:Tol biopolymer transport system component
MGEVYRARDTRLGRNVAIKVLPLSFAAIAQSTARFEREAQVLASLNHPGIASIFGFEELDGVHGIVMEMVEGPTLADRLRYGPMPIEEALPIAKQVAEALEYAHERSIIHRDLKPSNVKVTNDGAVKLLDFGLAKVIEGDSAGSNISSSPTISAGATQAGIILGTAAYMSPEQARGKSVDRRSDIWAFGVLLFEMLTGQPLYGGETTSDILARVIEREPDLSRLPPSTPTRISELIRRCLTKNPRQRLRDIGEARVAIEETVAGRRAAELKPPTATSHRSRGRDLALVGLGLIVGAILAASFFRRDRAPEDRKAVSRFSLFLPAGDVIGFGLDFSPDGSALVYNARHGATTQLYLRPMDRLPATPLPGTEGALQSFFSPDGQWIGFFAPGSLKKISVNGGQPVTLCEVRSARGGSWAPNDTIVFSPSFVLGSLMWVSAAGGTPEKLTTLNSQAKEVTHRWPEILPGGKAVVYVIGEAKDVGLYEESKIAVERLDTHEKQILPVRGTYPRYSPSGHLLFVRQNRIFAVPFDLARLEVTGPPTPVLDGIAVTQYGIAGYALSSTGSLAYVPGATSTEGVLSWTDRTGSVEALKAPTRAYFEPHLSPDGQRVAVTIGTGSTTDVWVYEFPRGTLTRLTFDGHDISPVWSPDGRRIAYAANRSRGWEILSKLADGSGAEETLIPGQNLFQIPGSWSPDGKYLAYMLVSPETGTDIWILPLAGDRKPWPLAQTKCNEQQPRFSPDGHWIAYTSDESGRSEIYVQPFPGPGGKFQVSTEGGYWPVWARDGRELSYLNGNRMMSVSITTRPSFDAATPRFLTDASPFLPGRFNNAAYDMSVEGKRFLFVRAKEENVPEEVRVVLNWSEEVKRLSPSGNQP